MAPRLREPWPSWGQRPPLPPSLDGALWAGLQTRPLKAASGGYAPSGSGWGGSTGSKHTSSTELDLPQLTRGTQMPPISRTCWTPLEYESSRLASSCSPDAGRPQGTHRRSSEETSRVYQHFMEYNPGRTRGSAGAPPEDLLLPLPVSPSRMFSTNQQTQMAFSCQTDDGPQPLFTPCLFSRIPFRGMPHLRTQGAIHPFSWLNSIPTSSWFIACVGSDCFQSSTCPRILYTLKLIPLWLERTPNFAQLTLLTATTPMFLENKRLLFFLFSSLYPLPWVPGHVL